MPIDPNRHFRAVVGFVSRLWNRTIQAAGTNDSDQFLEITPANPAFLADSNPSLSLSTRIGDDLQKLFWMRARACRGRPGKREDLSPGRSS